MQNKETYDEIFNPKPVELLIGDNDSNVFACGKNYNTELTFKGYRYLTHPSGLSLNRKYKIIDVSTGNEHTALLTELGYVFVFGSTLHNKLGLEGTTVVNIGSPKLLPLSEQEQITKVVCGPFHTLALTSQDQVWGWGGTLHKKTGTRDSRPSVVYGFDKV
jgi:alpha-tubulin suppressor-like RCC1 family protein